MKRTLFISTGIVFFLILGIGMYLFFTSRESQQDTPDEIKSSDIQEQRFIIEEKKEMIGNRIIETSPIVGEGEYLIVESERISELVNPDYRITYYEETGEISMLILKKPLKETQILAEKDLLKTLNISKEDACLLNIYVGTIRSVDEEIAGKNIGLSFCENGRVLPN